MSDKQFHKRYSDDYQDEFEFHDHLKILKKSHLDHWLDLKQRGNTTTP